MSRIGLAGGAAALLGVVASAGAAGATGFTNGGFEAGDISGWTQGGGYRAGVNNAGLSPAYFNGGGGFNDGGRGAIMNLSSVDPNVGSNIGSLVYAGNFSYRAEDTTYGGYATYIQQTVSNYTDPDIFFAWKSVLLGAHGTLDAATMIISLMDDTTSTELIHREYNAANNGSGVDARFSLFNDNFYTPAWQIEHLAIDSSLTGHTFTLSVLGSDCQPTGHWGYVYLDGFGAVKPPPGPGIPEPAAWALMISGFGLAGTALRRRRLQAPPPVA